jgi:hypothetical protein
MTSADTHPYIIESSDRIPAYLYWVPLSENIPCLSSWDMPYYSSLLRVPEKNSNKYPAEEDECFSFSDFPGENVNSWFIDFCRSLVSPTC